MSEYWFKPRRYGIGATPTSWEGWAITAAYVVAVVALAAWFQAHAHAHVWILLAVLAWLTGVLIFVSWKRTKGGWRWRWGDPD